MNKHAKTFLIFFISVILASICLNNSILTQVYAANETGSEELPLVLEIVDREAQVYEPVILLLHINSGTAPYYITVYCGKETIHAEKYNYELFISECVFSSAGEQIIRAEVRDSKDSAISSEEIFMMITDPSGKTPENNDQPIDTPDAKSPDTKEKSADKESDNFELRNSSADIIILVMLIAFIVISAYLYLKWTIPEWKKYSHYIKKMQEVMHRAELGGHSQESIHRNLSMQGHKTRHIKKALMRHEKSKQQ